jgi:hypothetical protein
MYFLLAFLFIKLSTFRWKFAAHHLPKLVQELREALRFGPLPMALALRRAITHLFSNIAHSINKTGIICANIFLLVRHKFSSFI